EVVSPGPGVGAPDRWQGSKDACGHDGRPVPARCIGGSGWHIRRHGERNTLVNRGLPIRRREGVTRRRSVVAELGRKAVNALIALTLAAGAFGNTGCATHMRKAAAPQPVTTKLGTFDPVFMKHVEMENTLAS